MSTLKMVLSTILMVFYLHMKVSKAENRAGLELALDSITLTSRNNDANNAQPFPDVVLQEVEFSGGNSGSSSRWTPTKNSAADAFTLSGIWESGSDADGKGPRQPFPHLIWYDFGTAFIPGRVSFSSRLDEACKNEGFCGATKWQFIATNDPKCNRYSKWTTLCEDLSGRSFTMMSQSKYCTVKESVNQAFRCLGISVLESSFPTVAHVSLGGIKMWKKIVQES